MSGRLSSVFLADVDLAVRTLGGEGDFCNWAIRGKQTTRIEKPIPKTFLNCFMVFLLLEVLKNGLSP
jgi:hypothetical protein